MFVIADADSSFLFAAKLINSLMFDYNDWTIIIDRYGPRSITGIYNKKILF